MATINNYIALLSRRNPHTLSAAQLSILYSNFAGIISGLLGHDLPGHPIPTNGDPHSVTWLTGMRDHCTHVATLLRDAPNTNAQAAEIALLNTSRNDAVILKIRLRFLFSHLHESWKLDHLLRDVNNISQMAAQSNVYGWMKELRDYGDCLDSLERILRCNCFASMHYNTTPGFRHPLDLHADAMALQPRDISTPGEQDAVNSLSVVCGLLHLDWDAVQHQLRTYAVPFIFQNPSSPRLALSTGDFQSLARHTNAAIGLLETFDDDQEDEASGSTLGRELARAVIRTQCTWFRSIDLVNNRLEYDLSGPAHTFRGMLQAGHTRPVPRLYLTDQPLVRVDSTIFQEWFDALVDDPTEREEWSSQDDEDNNVNGNGNGGGPPGPPRPPPRPHATTRAEAVAWAEAELARNIAWIRQNDRNPPPGWHN